MHRGHPIGSIHFPRLTGHFSLSQPCSERCSLLPVSACHQPHLLRAFLPRATQRLQPLRSRRSCAAVSSLKGTGGRTEAASATSGVSFPTLQAETWEKGGGCLSFFLSQNPGITTLLGFMRIVHCSLRRWLSIKARIDSLGNKLKNPPQAFQQNYLRY